jgi:hypothetical protein
MTALGYLRAEDRLPDHTKAPGGVLDPALLLGRWFATDHDAGGVVRLELSQQDGALFVRAFGANDGSDSSDGSNGDIDDDPEPYDWGDVEATSYGQAVTSTGAMAFSAVYNFGFMVTVLAAYAKQGILVLDTFNSFTDSSGRSNYFSREFFHR